MSSLFSIMSIAIGALQSEQGALDVTTNNVANANTPGYSRQRADLVETAPVVVGRLTLGTGVNLQRVESIRDPILELRIQQETQQQGSLNSFVSSMQQLQVMFNQNTGGDIGTQVSNFFSSVNQLSTNPQDLSLRQGVLTAAGNLANSFRTTANNLQLQRTNIDLEVTQGVQQVDTLTTQIAKLNGQITAIENLKQDAGSLVDQRNTLIGQLSNLLDVSSFQSDNGLTLTTSDGTALVAGTQSFALTAQPDISGVQHIFTQGKDITGKITSGEISGLLQVRDQKIPNLLTSLDTLAAGLVNSLNTANKNGFDLSGTAGGNIFVPPPSSGQGTAASMAVFITDPSLIAASSDGSPGSNGNIATLTAVQDQPVAGGQTPTDYYSNILFGVGSDISNGVAEQNASQLILNQLQDQRGSISGVSLDEEAANMVRFQRAYDASARLVTTVDQMLQTIINMKAS